MNKNKKKFLNKKQRFILTFIGNIVYSIGIFLPFGIGQYSVYITSYLHHYNSKVNLHFGNLMMPILILFLCLSAPIGGILERKFGMKLSLIINSIILELLMFLFISITNIWLIFLTIILMGISLGTVIAIPEKNICYYYPAKRGIIIAIYSSINTIIGSFVSVLGEKIINPKKIVLNDGEIFYPLNVAKNYIKFYKLGLVMLPICSLVSTILIQKYIPENEENKLVKNSAKSDDEKIAYSKNIKAAVCNNRIWKIAYISIFSQFAFGFLVSSFRVYGALISINGALMQYAPLFFGISQIIFGPLWGYINDKFQSYKIVKIICLIFIVHSIIISIFIQSNIIYIISLFIGSIINIGINSITRPYLMKIYGMKYIIEIGGVITICVGIINILKGGLSVLISMYYKTGKELQIPYRIIVIIGIGLNIIAYIFASKEKDEPFIYPFELNNENKIDISSNTDNNMSGNIKITKIDEYDVKVNNDNKL